VRHLKPDLHLHQENQMAAKTRAASRSDLTALRRGVITAYRWLVLGFLLAGGIQIFLAGLGVFSFRDQDAAVGSSAFDAHQTLGFTRAVSRSSC
jgi:hypothetical protein